MSRRTRRPFIFLLHEGKLLQFLERFAISKRQRFIVAVLVLSFGLFVSQHFLGKGGVFIVFFLSLLTVVFLYMANRQDIKQNFSPFLFVLPFFYSLAFGLFFFLAPARFLTRISMTVLYGIGLYSLFLSENIFSVGSLRTIGLVSSAKTVTFLIMLLSYFFLSNVVFSLDLSMLPKAILIFLYTFFLMAQSFWTYTLEKLTKWYFIWIAMLSLCFFEIALMLWFWPSDPTFTAIFLSGLFYIFVGLSHVWLEKRLFRSILWEYIWAAVIVFSVLFLFTSWRP